MAFPLFETKNTLMNAHAGSSGIIELQKDSNNEFYVEADLASYPFGSSKNSTNSLQITDSVKMMISLSNDETLVVTNCLNFSSYDCGKYHCYKEDWNANLSFPSFNASAQAAEGYIYLGYFFWALTTTNLYIAQSCQTGNYSPEAVGLDRYGVLGLGTGNGSDGNYITSQLFSVYMKPDLTGGKLLFMNNAGTYAKSEEPSYNLTANSSWQTKISNATLQFSNSSINLTADNLIFDINSDAIGLPNEDFKNLMLGFLADFNIYCNFVPYKPTVCLFLDKVVDLPDITLSLNNNTNLTIPSSVYSTPFEKLKNFTSFTLKFKGIGSTLPSKSYVSPAFNNSVILDANFMRYYYTVFDATSGSNKIYLYQAAKSTPDDGDGMNAVIGGTIAAIFLIAICYCASKKKRVENSASDKNDSTQAPLIYSSAYNSQPQSVYQPTFNGGTTIGYGQNN